MKKSLSVILFLLVALIFATSATNVDATYSIDRVEVNGVDMTPVGVPLTSPILKVDRGDSVGIRVEFRSDVSANDVRVRAWIEGYEYSDIEDSTELFDE